MTKEAFDLYYKYIIEPRLTETMKLALKYYSGTGSSRISDYLLNGETKNIDMENKIELLRKSIKLCQLPSPVTVFHGISRFSSIQNPNFINLNEQLITTKTFFSTSLSFNTACNFANLNIEKEKYLIEINLPTGYPAFWLEPLSQARSELELLLLNDITFEVKDKIIFKRRNDEFIKLKVMPK